MTASETLKCLEAIRCWLSPDAAAVKTAKAELESLIEDIAREGLEGQLPYDRPSTEESK